MEVKVFTTPTWPWCVKVKDYLKENAIPFAELDVSRDRNAAVEMIQKSGQRGVPVVEIDGMIIVGFDKDSIDRKLKLQ